MTRLPAGISPADGFVRVTTCPRRVCLPTTVNPSLTSSSRALMKVIPTTSGTGSRGGPEEDALAVGRPGGGAALEPAGAAGRELAAPAGSDVAGATAAVGWVAAAAELDPDPGLGAATGSVAAGRPVATGVVGTLLAASCLPLGVALSRHAVTGPASSRISKPAAARAPRPARR